MEKIYLKNYRGFRDQMIEIDDINFFVGENSTGKTSILKIINLLSSAQFWYDYEFNNDDVELGYFDEIISKNIDEKFFQLAIEKPYKEYTKDKYVEKTLRILLEFKRKGSVPMLSKIKAVMGKFDVFINVSTDSTKFSYKPTVDSNFKDWVKDLSNIGTKRGNIAYSFRLPIPILFNLIEQRMMKESDDAYSQNFIREKLFENFVWIAPIRAKPKRIYESYKMNFSPEGEHIPQLLRKILSNSNVKEKKKITSILESFGKQSNLFDKIEVKELGRKDSSPFEINITYKDTEVKLQNVGYGVSQSLPIIIEILSSKNKCFTIQQPEVHLHPKAQAAFGTFLFNSVANDKNKFIIETHSDFTINRFRYELMKKKSDKIKTQVLFFERTKNGNKLTSLEIKGGVYQDEIPESFREFFIDEELKLLEI